MRALGKRFFAVTADKLAPALLGKVLAHGDCCGRIVEAEAYLGPEDAASHARFGKTDRNAVMFGPGGISYVYLIYGMYDMFNVVAGPDGRAGAVLIRALEPGVGIDANPATARGPGKLTRALGIDRNHNGLDLTVGDLLSVCTGRLRRGEQVAAGARIGVGYAGAWAEAPLRFWIDGHPSVSRVGAGKK